MKSDGLDLFKVKNAIKSNPDSPIIIMSNKLGSSKLYKERVKPYLSESNYIFEISNSDTNDGLPFMHSILLLCGRWWENRNAYEIMERDARLAKLIIPVTHLPASFHLKGGEK